MRDDDYLDQTWRRRDRDWDEDDFVRRPAQNRPALAGIASFVLALLLGPGVLLLFVVVGVVETNSPGTIPNNSPVEMLLGLMVLGCLGGMLLGAIFGVVALMGEGGMKVFALLGLLLNAIELLGTIGLMVVGMIMS